VSLGVINVSADIAKGQLFQLGLSRVYLPFGDSLATGPGQNLPSKYTIDFLKPFGRKGSSLTRFDALLNRVFDCLWAGLPDFSQLNSAGLFWTSRWSPPLVHFNPGYVSI
jgi:hypothetical protein